MSAVCKNKYIYIWKDSRQSVVSAVAVCAFCLLGSDLLSLQAITPGYRSRLKAYWTRMPCWHNKMYSCITVVPHKGVLYLTHTHIYIHITVHYITLQLTLHHITSHLIASHRITYVHTSQYSTVRYSTVQYMTLQHITIHYITFIHHHA